MTSGLHWSIFSAISLTGKSTELLPLWFGVRILDGGPCGHRIMSITSAFQTDDAGSIPADRSSFEWALLFAKLRCKNTDLWVQRSSKSTPLISVQPWVVCWMECLILMPVCLNTSIIQSAMTLPYRYTVYSISDEVTYAGRVLLD